MHRLRRRLRRDGRVREARLRRGRLRRHAARRSLRPRRRAVLGAGVRGRGGRRRPAGHGRRDVALALGLGAFGYAAQAGCFFAALERIDASLLSLLLYTFPSMVAVAAVVLRPGAGRGPALRRARAGVRRARARARQREGRHAQPGRRRPRARRGGRLHDLHPDEPGHGRAAIACAAVRARLHRCGRHADYRVGAGGRPPPRRGHARRLGLAARHRGGLDGRRREPVLRGAQAGGPDERLDPVHRGAGGDRDPRLPRLRRGARAAPARSAAPS